MRTRYALAACTLLTVFAAPAAADFLALNPPPDADKPGVPGDNSCWLATASNMLAGAGYGAGASVQARANDIYSDLTSHYGIANGGWIDTALNWWLGSANNTWTTNPYKIVSVYGNKSPKYPWANANGKATVGKNLRDGNFVGLSISWPSSTAVGRGGHAITAWGDDGAFDASGIGTVSVTDSDTDSGGNIQTYTYDAFNNPNPTGTGGSEGNGWYFNYNSGSDHAYIKHIAVLSPVKIDLPFFQYTSTKQVVSMLLLRQNYLTPATDMHYKVSTTGNLLNYNTYITRNAPPPAIAEHTVGQIRDSITVDWNLTGNTVSQGSYVLAVTNAALPNVAGTGLSYSDAHFTYPINGILLPEINWSIISTVLTGPQPNNASGGYIIGSIDIFGDLQGTDLLGTVMFEEEYKANEDPEHHIFGLSTGFDDILYFGNLRFGHSYGLLDPDELGRFQGYSLLLPAVQSLTGRDDPYKLDINFTGLLPYPSAEDFPYVPEPASLSLLALGVAGLLTRRRH